MGFKISIDKGACIGCGACVATCEASFAMGDDGKAKPKKAEVSDVGCAQDAADGCPVSCISIKKG